MIEEWFRWERESTIHPLFVPYIGSFTKQREYIGTNWPTTLLIFRGNVVLWCNKIEPLHKFGQKLINMFMDKKKLNNVKKDFQFYIRKLKKHFNKIEKTDLKKLPNGKIFQLYQHFLSDYIDYWKVGMLAEPVAIRGERLIRAKLKHIKDNKLLNQYLSVLTSTTRKSFSRQEEEDLLKIAIQIKGDVNLARSKNLLKQHAKKYFWLHNNYYKTEILDEKFFGNGLKALLRKYNSPKKYLSEMKAIDKSAINNKKIIIKKLELNEKEKALVNVIDYFGWFQDERKKYNMIANHYLDIFLSEIGKRAKLSLMEMKFTTPDETENILNGIFDRNKIKKRMKNCLFVWEGNRDNYKLYIEKEAIKKEKQLFSAKEGIHEVTEIEGMTANQGRVRGYAHITMSPNEAKNIKKGEILVTSMTSPDFIVGIKKAVAIVTNEGGITSHAAIISREFGIPCVIGTKIATKVLKTGDYVEVDGVHGFVRILKKKA